MSLSFFTLVVIILFTAIVVGALTAFWMRKRIAPRVRPPRLEHTPGPEQTLRDSRQTSLSPLFRPTKLIFGTSEEATPVMELSLIKASALPRNKHRLDPSSNRLNAFSPFLELVAATLATPEFGPGSCMQVLVQGPLALASEPESFLPFVRGPRGQVEELGKLKNSGQLLQVIGNGMGWQLATAIAARTHLADINRKLDYIRRGVDEIKGFLTNERRCKVVGTLDYLRQAVKTLGQKESPETLRNQMEQIERELLQVHSHIMRDLGASADKIGAIIEGGLSRRKTRANAILERVDEMCELQKEWLLCMVARTVNWQVLSIFPGNRQLKITRKESIYRSIEEFTGFLQRVHERLHEKIASVRSVLDTLSSAQQDKSILIQIDLKRRIQEDHNQMFSDAAMMREEMRKFADRLWSPQKPIVLALILDQGRIVEAYELEAK